MRTRVTIPILLVVLAFGLFAGPGAMAGELTVAKQLRGTLGEERYNDGVTKIPRSNEVLTLPDGRVRYIVQLEDAPVASYRGGIGRFEATSPVRTGARRLDMRAPQSVAYRGHLRDRQESFARELTRMAPEATIGHRYQVVFNGLSVAVNPGRIDAISRMPGVKQVYPERLYYQSMDASIPLINAPAFWAALGVNKLGDPGAGIKVAVVDTGLYADHEMFDGTGFSYPPGPPDYPLADDWCGLNPMDDFCNGKIIVARHFRTIALHPDEIDSPIGVSGHGTWTAGSAVGNPIVGADAGDGVLENISGVAPAAWLMVYKALWWNGTQGSGSSADLIAAVDAAVDDGADVINNSWGGGPGEDPNTDEFGDVFEAAEEAGVVAVVAAANAGPGAGTIACPGCQPSVLTVGGTTTNRIHALTLDMFSPAEHPGTVAQPTGLGCLEGTGPEFVSSFGPESVKYAGDIDAGNFLGCDPFPAGSFTNSIALISRGTCNFSVKVDNAEAAGAGAVVVFNNVLGPPITMGALEETTISSCMISNDAGLLVVDFLGFYPDSTGLINYPQQRATNDNWQDFMYNFSSRGPNGDPDVLKPEIAAPGQSIFSATSPLAPDGDGEFYMIASGTSGASPHVAGAAALVMQQHPLWSPTEVKTALTSTTIRDGVVKGDGVTPADPFDRGAGRLDLSNTFNAAVTFDQAGMADSNCVLDCEFERTLVDQGTGPSTWMAYVENASENLIVVVDPSTIMLPGPGMPPAVEPGPFSVNVDTTFVEQGQWHFADIVWRYTINGGTSVPAPPDASMPLAVFAASSTNAAALSKTVDKDVAQPTEVLTYDISLTNPGITGVIELFDAIPANSEFIPGSQEAWVDGAPDFNFDYDPFALPNGAMEWSGMIAGGIEVSPSSSPLGYVSLATMVPPMPCGSTCDDTFTILSGFGSFDYLGESYNSVVMGSNGIVVIGNDVTDASSNANQDLPDSATPNNILAPFWTDIDMDGASPDDTGAGIWYSTVLTDDPFTYLVMEWAGVEEWDVPGDTYTFQVWIGLETSEIFFVYENLDGLPSSLTVGAEDIAGFVGSSYYYDGDGTAPAVGTDLEVVGEAAGTAHFSFQVEAGWEIEEPIANLVEIWSKELGDPAFASAITHLEELDVELYVEGMCPGIINVHGYGATPFGPVRVFRGEWPGASSPLFRRNCVGTEVDLDRASQFPPMVRADGMGSFHFTRRVAPWQCHQRIQAVDMRSCDVSNTEPFPHLYGDDDDMLP